MKICLIRSSPAHAPGLLHLLRPYGDVLDACHPQHLRIARVEIGAEPRASVRGTPLREFDRIFFLGAPVASIESGHDQGYIYEEAHAATLSALGVYRSRLVNAGVLLQTSGLLRSSQHYVSRLARVGWRTAGVAYHYDFEAKHVERIARPAAAEEVRWLLVCTQRSHRLLPDVPGLPAVLAPQVLATQRWMARERIDVLGLSLAMAEGAPVLHGACVHPEAVFEMRDLADLMADVLS